MTDTKAIPQDHPYRREFARWERGAASDILASLQKLQDSVFSGISRENADEVFARLRNDAINEQLRVSLFNALSPVVRGAVDASREMHNREILGVKNITSPNFDWEMVHEIALDYLARRTFSLTYANVHSITAATASRLRRIIDNFITDPDMTMRDVIEASERLFDVVRGETIAVTEVTRTFADAEIISMREAGIIKRKRWNTANDELVCPICGPLNQRVVDLDANFPGGHEAPPAHPRCRCWITGDVDVNQN